MPFHQVEVQTNDGAWRLFAQLGLTAAGAARLKAELDRGNSILGRFRAVRVIVNERGHEAHARDYPSTLTAAEIARAGKRKGVRAAAPAPPIVPSQPRQAKPSAYFKSFVERAQPQEDE